jgi:hypothetical protein
MMPVIKVTCAYSKCKVKFTPTRPWQKFHATKCRQKDWEEKHPRVLVAPNSTPS